MILWNKYKSFFILAEYPVKIQKITYTNPARLFPRHHKILYIFRCNRFSGKDDQTLNDIM